GVDAVFGVYPVAMVFGEPLRAIGLTALFVSRERQDEVTRGDPALFFQADKIGDQYGVALFDVRRAATIEKAIDFVELERIHGPVLAQRFYNIKVGDKQDGFSRAASVQANDKVFLVRKRPINVNIFCGEARCPKASSNSFCRSGYVSGRCISGVDFNELLKNITGSLMFG